MLEKIQIIKYDPLKRKAWDNFLKSSKNGTFLFYRDYMDYHSDRFVDSSLMIYDQRDVLIALLPANLVDNQLISHGGLTYGGFITDYTMKTEKMMSVFQEIINHLKQNNISKIVYKAIPHIYHKIPSEEDLYSLFRCNFTLFRRDASSTMNIKNTEVKGSKKNGYRKAILSGLKIEETFDSTNILRVANSSLSKKYGTCAAHTNLEMNLLKNRFKNEIIMLNLTLDEQTVGGAILYLVNNVIHAQYITTNDEAKRKRGLDFMVVSIIEQFKDNYEWFDFGISTEKNGTYLNTSLIKSKEEFNMSAVCYDTYELVIT